MNFLFFFSFYQPVWFLTKCWLHLSGLSFPEPSSKIKTGSCLKIKSAQKLNGCYLIQALIGPDSRKVFVGGVCLQSEGFF